MPRRFPKIPQLFSDPETPSGVKLFPDPQTSTEIKPPTASDVSVQLVRSARRRRTYKWSLSNGQIRLEVPSGLKPADEARIVEQVVEKATKRLARAERASDAELLQRARTLARRHLPDALPRLRSVAWTARQGRRWGSCTSETGAIRLSERLHGLPDYVLEAVLVHELAHLLEPNHSPSFHSLADRYPLAERARGFLEAVDRGLRDAAWDDESD
jgi:predicted metal-dependent hydrolase